MWSVISKEKTKVNQAWSHWSLPENQVNKDLELWLLKVTETKVEKPMAYSILIPSLSVLVCFGLATASDSVWSVEAWMVYLWEVNCPGFMWWEGLCQYTGVSFHFIYLCIYLFETELQYECSLGRPRTLYVDQMDREFTEICFESTGIDSMCPDNTSCLVKE